MLLQRTQNNLRVFAAVMTEGEKRGRPDRKLTDQNNHSEEQSGERDWVDEMFESLAYDEERDKRIFGRYYEKPSQNYVINSVVDVLDSMREGRIHIPSLEPGGKRLRIELDRKQKADIDMITQGFMAVAYEHLHGGYQSAVQIHFIKVDTFSLAFDPNPIAATLPMPEKREKLKIDAPLDEFRREFRDRFELTYEQAKAVQKIAKRVNLSYDPGGRELTPENIAKRTFRAKDYVNRPIDHSRRY